MGYSAAGLGFGLQSGLGMIAQALMGVQERKDAQAQRALEEERDRAAADEAALNRARYNAEQGVTEGFTDTSVRMDAPKIPTDVMADARLRGPGGVVPTGKPSPLAIGGGDASGVFAGQRPGLGAAASRPSPLDATGRETIETPQVGPAPDVAFRAPYVEQDITKGTRFQNQQRLAGLEAMQREQAEAPQRAAILASLPPEMAAQLQGQTLDGLLKIQAEMVTREPKAPVMGSPEWLAAIREQEGVRAEFRGTGGTGPGNESAVDRRTREANEAIIGDIDDAVAKLTGNPGAIGLKGLAPDLFLQRFDPEGVQTRAALANVTSQIMLMRSGGAVSDAEFGRLEPFLAQDTDTPQAALNKLTNIREFFARKVENPGVAPTPVPAGPAAPPAAAPPSRGDAFRARFGQ